MSRENLRPMLRRVPMPILAVSFLAFLPVHVLYGAGDGIANWWSEFRQILDVDKGQR